MSPISRRGAPQIGIGPSGTARDEEMDLDMVEESLMQLTILIPYSRDEDIPFVCVVILAVVGVALRDCSAR